MTSNRALNNLLQFKAGSHIIGFDSTKAYLVAPDHALTVEFVGTKGVVPKAEYDTVAVNSSHKAGLLKKVVYNNLWDGISLIYEATKTGVAESSYFIEAGADVANIRLRYNVPVEKQENGALKVVFKTGYLTESAPIAWQEINGRRILVEVAFKVSGNEVGFKTGKYDHNKPLIIDPVYSWNTFYGSGDGDDAYAIAVDGSGNIYMTGYSITPWGTPISTFTGDGFNEYIFVLKLDNTGTLKWNTFYGSNSGDAGTGIAVDGVGNVYVTGYSFGTWGTPLNAYNGGALGAIFVLKLNSSGAYQWNTFYSSGSGDAGQAIAVDSSGNAYVTGYSSGTWGSPVNGYSGGTADIFVLKLDNSGIYQWNTFLGSGIDDEGNGIAVDGSGNSYVTGFSTGTWGTPINAYTGSGADNIIVLKLGNTGTYQWHTFFGSGVQDDGNSITVDNSGNLFITGHSYGSWGSNILNPFSGASNGDIFVLKLDGSGAYKWNTFYGSTNGDAGYSISLDRSGSVYVAGDCSGSWGSNILNAFSGGAVDICMLKLDTSGTYQWNTFYGSGNTDETNGIAVDARGNVLVAGESFGTWQTPFNPYNGGTSGSAGNIYALQLQPSTCSVSAVKIAGTNNTFNSLQGAYNTAASGQTLMIQALTLTETVSLNRGNVDVILQGGYECNFPSVPPGWSTISGSITISGGSATVDGLIIQ
ncbi:MAG TPA: SBBP repeat-containing protein [Dissulfurispiraceae bacterium]|nr:SBBP repeat-containing protein [Dissulfurispiraceae bacterium]